MADYSSIPLLDLLRLIVAEADSDALYELHANRPVCLFDGKRLVIAEYLLAARFEAERCGWGENAFHAYDLALDRFWKNLDSPQSNRLYASVYEKLVAEALSPLAREVRAAELLRKLVVRHYHWCLRESARTRIRTRFEWDLPEGTLLLLFPKTLSGHDRRRWLEVHFPDADATRAGEKERIQILIDEMLGTGTVSLEEGVNVSEWDLPTPLRQSLDLEGLGRVVSEEKAVNLEDQRPAIRVLGAGGVRSLVREIFERLLHDTYEERSLAEAFGLSASTFSRFAGRQPRSSGLPDLWANVASILQVDSELQSILQSRELTPISV